MTADSDDGDRRLTIDLAALYDVTRDSAIELEYELAERGDGAIGDESRAGYFERWRAVRAERRNLPLGTDMAARRGMIAVQDRWRAEIEALRER